MKNTKLTQPSMTTICGIDTTRALLDDFYGLVDELSNEITRRLQRAVNDEYNTEGERSNDGETSTGKRLA